MNTPNVSAMPSDKEAEVVDESELSSSPRPLSSDRVEAGDQTDVTSPLDVVKADNDDNDDGESDRTVNAATVAMLRYSAAEAAASSVLWADGESDRKVNAATAAVLSYSAAEAAALVVFWADGASD
jgi:hypothetical protein